MPLIAALTRADGVCRGYSHCNSARNGLGMGMGDDGSTLSFDCYTIQIIGEVGTQRCNAHGSTVAE